MQPATGPNLNLILSLVLYVGFSWLPTMPKSRFFQLELIPPFESFCVVLAFFDSED
jgi:hypothetical protein